MADFSKFPPYQIYKKSVAAGELSLPPYDLFGDYIKFYPGELFCRVPGCTKSTHQYFSLPNLKKHVESHEGYIVYKGTVGGRIPQKEIDTAAAWYTKITTVEESSSSAVFSPASSRAPSAAVSPAASRPSTRGLATPGPASAPRPPRASRPQVEETADDVEWIKPPLPLGRNNALKYGEMRRYAKTVDQDVPCEGCQPSGRRCPVKRASCEP
ncbi:uncharacterized protein ATNIH1004_000337 [Aspergillus tanneri]|uniref:Uncharacterized protein n=1 Tax=Aspergillus tanneri TaxID=1220188 RepID=A0A5M9N1G3_9EURO|nr:uncharacterized protein ATNIH1004_000337 [Aspergillus tanneri]KAA8651454.1 hypothetical protein ATNIH1004_000337 [Aspergillus tanneri]